MLTLRVTIYALTHTHMHANDNAYMYIVYMLLAITFGDRQDKKKTMVLYYCHVLYFENKCK